jgi:hypothetical protein
MPTRSSLGGDRGLQREGAVPRHQMGKRWERRLYIPTRKRGGGWPWTPPFKSVNQFRFGDVVLPAQYVLQRQIKRHLAEPSIGLSVPALAWTPDLKQRIMITPPNLLAAMWLQFAQAVTGTFREESSAQGRWLNPDPSGMSAVSLSDPQTLNRYAYVRGSAMGLTDVNGLSIGVNRGLWAYLMSTAIFGGNGGINDNGGIGFMTADMAAAEQLDAAQAAAKAAAAAHNTQQTGCSAEARAKIVGLDGHSVKATLERALMHIFHVEHMFWTVTGSNGIQKDLSGGPTEGTGGQLGEGSRNTDAPADANHGNEADYRDSGKVIWTAPQTGDLCGRVDAMENAVGLQKPHSLYTYLVYLSRPLAIS